MKCLLKFLLLLFVSICGAAGSDFAQKEGQAAIDSMLKELSSDSYRNKEDTSKVELLNGLSYVYHSVNPDEGIKYGQQALDLATKLEWQPGIARADNVLGNNYLRKSDNPRALEYYQQALKIYEETGYKKGIGTVTCNIGLLYQSQNDNSKALEYHFKALKIDEEIGNKPGIAAVYDNVGDIYKSQNDYPKALEYYLKALKINEETGRKVGIASVTEDIGIIYGYQKNYTEAIAYMQKALKMDEELGDVLGVGWGLTNIGKTYLSMIRDASAGSRSTHNAALADTAINYLQQGLTIGITIHAPDILQACYKNLAALYKLSGDYKRSLESYKKYSAIKDSVFSKENSEKIVKMEYNGKRFADSLKTEETKKIADIHLRHQRNYTYLGIAVILLLSGFSFFMLQERAKSEKLLLNILPAEVAAELKSKGVIKAKNFNNVTVLFTDFVNFTKAGEHMGPQALVNELHTCFKAFDEITGKYNLEKIKTIGDAYLAVAGMPAADPQHAEHVVQAAIEINAFINDRLAKLGEKTFAVRIGIHSGSVVAGIVGLKKFAYDIWGDTVNTAARMEQNSEPGKINISQATYELVKDKFVCAYRGETDAKNKGMMKMYFVS